MSKVIVAIFVLLGLGVASSVYTVDEHCRRGYQDSDASHAGYV